MKYLVSILMVAVSGLAGCMKSVDHASECKVERTLSIIKPDAVAHGNVDAIQQMLRDAGLEIIAQKKIVLTNEDARKFYSVHSSRPFYDSLCEFMSRGVIVVQVLQGEGAISKYRQLMGNTDPAYAEEGTIRKKYATNKGENAVHGSDSAENARNEITFFFPEEAKQWFECE